MNPKLHVGIVGCGEATQILHLPSLAQLVEQFEVAALCDVSQEVLAGVGGRWGVGAQFGHYEDLLELDLDAVLVANPHAYHSEVVLAALSAGKHVLVEKPMCLTLREADAIIAAQQKTGLVVQVGTMRRFADAFLEAARLVWALPNIRLARVHDVIGNNALFIRDTSRVIRGRDVPGELLGAGRRLERQLVQEAVGTDDPDLVNSYWMLLGLSTHDLSAMRELLGTPQGVLYAAQRHGGGYITAAFDYGPFVCHFETGVHRVAVFDAYLAVYGDERVVRVQYNTPYVRNLPITLHITETDAENAAVTRRLHPAWNDPFVREWLAFYEAVRGGTPVKTDAADFRRDLELFAQMTALM